ncbi:inosine triphosphate pyrophosphatase [Vairimorpha necatrix]|uniref:Inosine triphosphate pyrophosphatase n=1 Tax=Vairimorpha necatrix TaxID=6039 RepID=A0AAX4JEW1_9MICR
MIIYFVTSSNRKFVEVSDQFDLHFEQLNMEITEIQGTKEEIAIHKLKNVCQLHPEKWIMIDDTSIDIDALNGFPGPYAKDFLNMGLDCIENLVSKVGRESVLSCILGLGNYNQGIFEIFSGSIKGKLIEGENNGKVGFDRIFLPNGSDIAYGDLKPEVKSKISHRGIAMRKIQEFIKEKQLG